MKLEDREVFGMAIGGLGSVAAAGALVAVRGHMAPVNIALVLVLIIVLGAVTGGRKAGVVSAIVAAVAFDFFATEPYNSLKINSAADIETAILLVVVGLAVGEIALQSDRIRSHFRDERRELRRIHHVAQLAAAGDSVDDVASAVVAELTETLHLRHCYFELAPFDDLAPLPSIAPTGAIETTRFRHSGNGFELPHDGVALPVTGGDVVLGRFVLLPTAGVGVSLEHKMVAVALADQLGVVLGRAAAK